ncbi:MAG: hypothetical protein U0835_09280 [Isosphaeraceae bacterium]
MAAGLFDNDEVGGFLADELRALLKAELVPGERLLWAGQPVPWREPVGCGLVGSGVLAGVLLSATALCLVQVFANPFAETAGLVTLGVITLVFGVIVAIAVASNLARRRRTRKARHRILFALTDRRAILWRPETESAGTSVISFRTGEVARVHRVEFEDGSGNVVFTPREPPHRYEFPHLSGFERIAEVRRVEEMARRILVDSQP